MEIESIIKSIIREQEAENKKPKEEKSFIEKLIDAELEKDEALKKEEAKKHDEETDRQVNDILGKMIL